MGEENKNIISFSHIETFFDYFTNKPITRWVLLLPGSGCAWAKKSGGCLMCGFKFSTYKYTRGRLLPSSIFKILYNYAYSKAKSYKPEELVVYNGGSYLNVKEIPYKFQMWLANKVAESTYIKTLFVESRPEYVTENILKETVRKLRGKKLKIGIGLECATDIIRYRCVNKGFSLSDYEKAINIAKKFNATILTYVFIKPLFLNEKESIEEAVKTANYCFNKGSDIVAFQSGFVQSKTPMEKLYSMKLYNPPWLWSILEVAKKTYNSGFIELGGLEDNPPPIAIPKNCEKCSPIIYNLLNNFKVKHDLNSLLKVNCECKKEWNKILKNKEETLKTRIDKFSKLL